MFYCDFSTCGLQGGAAAECTVMECVALWAMAMLSRGARVRAWALGRFSAVAVGASIPAAAGRLLLRRPFSGVGGVFFVEQGGPQG